MSKSGFPLSQLPDDVIGLILVTLPFHDLGNCAQVSRRLYRIASSNYIWKEKIANFFLLRRVRWVEQDPEYLRRFPWTSSPTLLSRLHISVTEILAMHRALGSACTVLSTHHDSQDEPVLRFLVPFRGKDFLVEHSKCKAPEGFAGKYLSLQPSLRVRTECYVFEIFAQDTTKMLVRKINPEMKEPDEFGVIMHAEALELPLTPDPSAELEPCYAKFVYRYLYSLHFRLCPVCSVRKRPLDYRAKIQPFCKPCWRLTDLDLYMNVEQMRHEFLLEPLDVKESTQGKLHKVSAESGKNRRRPRPTWETYYREVEVAQLAVLKWGSMKAVERRRMAEAQTETLTRVAKFTDEVKVPDSHEAKHVGTNLKRKRTAKAAESNNYGMQARNKSALSASVLGKRKLRKAAENKFYGEGDDDDCIAESNLGTLFSWGL